MSAIEKTEHTSGVITLYDILILINMDRKKRGQADIQHSKAMTIVSKMVSESPSFGLVAKYDTVNLNGLKVKTYMLSKNQAIAVGGKLDTERLMLVINRLEELTRIRVPETFADALQLAADLAKEKDVLLVENKVQSDTIEVQRKKIEEVTVLYEKHGQMVRTIMASDNLYKATQVGSRFGISAVLFNKIMNDAKVIRKISGIWSLRSGYMAPSPLAVLKEVLVPKKGENETVLEFAWTSKGLNWIVDNWDKALGRMSVKTRKSYDLAIKETKLSIPKKRDAK